MADEMDRALGAVDKMIDGWMDAFGEPFQLLLRLA
jgi:hypothetical protein